MHTIRDISRHPQHPRIHRGDIHFGIRCIDRPRAPLRRDEVQVVELAVVIERPRSKRGETRPSLRVRSHAAAGPDARSPSRSAARHACAPACQVRAGTSRPSPPAAHAVAEVTNGLRGNATATPVDSSRPGAACDATAALRYAVRPVSVNSRPENPAACTRRAKSPTFPNGRGPSSRRRARWNSTPVRS
jgi:hypothetical protein